jgi:hypothetical protein
LQGKPKNSEKTCPSATLSLIKIDSDIEKLIERGVTGTQTA